MTTTGFILEMEVGEFLKTKGYKIKVNQYFVDYDENKKREIDVIASKIVNEIEVFLIIECKQSAADDWIFVCTDKTPSRWYEYAKYSPQLPFGKNLKDSELFDHLWTLDHKTPLAQNFIVRAPSGKKGVSEPIYSSIKKMPKAVVGVVDYLGQSGTQRRMFVPVVVFNGQLFTAKYDAKLKVANVAHIQFESNLDSEAYTYHYNRLDPDNSFVLASRVVFPGESARESSEERKTNSPVARLSSQQLGSKHLLDFVTKAGLESFVSRMEKDLDKVDITLWPIKTEPEEEIPIS